MAKTKSKALPKVGDKVIGKKGAVGIIKEIKQDKKNAANGRVRETKPYAVIKWQNPKKGQQKTSTVQPGHLNHMETKGGIKIERSKPTSTKSSTKTKKPAVTIKSLKKGKLYREKVNSEQGYEDWEFTGTVVNGPNGKLYAFENDRGGYFFDSKDLKNFTPVPTTYTVGNRTFATKKEANAYKAEQRKKGKAYEIKESKKKPTHKVVSFTAKK